VRVHISANVEIFTEGRHRSCRLCMTRGNDRVHRQTDGHTHIQRRTERSIS